MLDICVVVESHLINHTLIFYLKCLNSSEFLYKCCVGFKLSVSMIIMHNGMNGMNETKHSEMMRINLLLGALVYCE